MCSRITDISRAPLTHTHTHPPSIPQFRDLKCGSREGNKVHMWSLPPSAALTGGDTVSRTTEPVDLPSMGKITKGPVIETRQLSQTAAFSTSVHSWGKCTPAVWYRVNHVTPRCTFERHRGLSFPWRSRSDRSDTGSHQRSSIRSEFIPLQIFGLSVPESGTWYRAPMGHSGDTSVDEFGLKCDDGHSACKCCPFCVTYLHHQFRSSCFWFCFVWFFLLVFHGDLCRCSWLLSSC